MSFPIGPFRRLPLGGGAKISPFLPLTFPHLELYLDSRLSLSSFIDGANVNAWIDQSGHSPTRDAITNLTDPTMGRSGVNLTPKGQPSVVFKTVADNQGLQARSTFTWPNPGSPTARGWTVYWYGLALAKVGYAVTNSVVWGGDAANVHYQQLLDDGGGGSHKYGFIDDGGGGNPHRFNTLASIQNQWHLHTVVLPNPNNNTVPGRYYLNGTLVSQTAGPANYKVSIAGVGGYALGNTTGFNVAFRGNVGCLVWFSDTHSQATINLFTLWASIFFGLT